MEMEFEKIQGHELLPVAGRLTRKERLLLTKLQEKQRIEALSSREEAGAQSPAASGLGLLDCEPSVAGVPESNPTLQGLPLKETRSQPLPDTQPKDQVIQQSYYPPPPTWDQVRNSVLNASIASGRFEDLLIVFSPECPTHHGRVSLPSRKLYANRTLVGHALPRADFLSPDTTIENGGNLTESDVDAIVDAYLDDSDLEDVGCRDDGGPDGEDKPLGIPDDYTNPKSKQPCTGMPMEDRPLSTDPADSYIDTLASAGTSSGAEHPHDVQQGLSSMTDPEKHRAESSIPQTLVVKDTAYRTWNALVFYAYTHQIRFLPLKSQGRSATIADVQDTSEPPACSPKSMYRMAMKYDSTELKALAISDIQSKLSTRNILEELFSRFTSRYPEIQTMQLDFVFAHLKHSDITAGLPFWVERFGRGELKECTDTFLQLVGRLVSNVSGG